MATSGARSDGRRSSVERVRKDDHDDIERAGSYDSSENDRVSQKTAVDGDNASDENEGDHLLEKDHIQQASHGPQPKISTCSAVAWMVVNTLATIGIVRLRLFSPVGTLVGWLVGWLYALTRWLLGVHQQGDIFVPAVEAGAADVCRLPLLHHLVDPLRPVPPVARVIRPASDGHQRNHPALCRHVAQRHPSEPVAGVLLRHLLPGGPDHAHADSRPHELRLVPSDASPECDPGAGSRLHGRRHGLLLRFPPDERRQSQDHERTGDDLRLLRHLRLVPVHGVDRQLPPEAADVQYAAALQPSAGLGFPPPLRYPICGYLPYLGGGAYQ